MKRLIIGMAATALMAGGLVGVSAETANAVCPYTGCVPTNASVTVPNAPVSKGGKAKICIEVSTSGSGKPRGKASIEVKRNGGRYSFSAEKRYDGRTCFTTGALNKKGKYTVRGSFDANLYSTFGDSSDSTTFRVVR